MRLFRNLWFWWSFVVSLVVVSLIWAAYRFNWTGTGFQGKTVWDWLSLLIIPLALALVALFFNQVNTSTERQIAQQRYEQDQQIALDKQREDLLQAYLDRMSDLLLKENLRNSQADAEVRNIARARTISVLMQLDIKRVEYVFSFIKEAELIDKTNPVISLKDADLSKVTWIRANLFGVNLREVKLYDANLSRTSLIHANLSKANLYRANLSNAYLIGADLNSADLIETDLTEADFTGADLIEAELIQAKLIRSDLENANLSRSNLKEADLFEANLGGVNFSGANLSGANLSRTDLSNADLSGSDLREADFSGANLRGVNLNRAIFWETKIDKSQLTPEQIEQARWR